MRFRALRILETLQDIAKTIQAVAEIAKDAKQAREILASRLSAKARAGDFDDAIQKLADSDALVDDFIKNG